MQVNAVINFSEQLKVWQEILATANEKSSFNFNTIEFSILTQQFNNFVNCLGKKIECLEPQQADKEENSAVILRRIFILNPDATPSSAADGESAKDFINESNELKTAASVLTLGFDIVVTLRVIKEIQNTKPWDLTNVSAIHFLFDALKERINSFQAEFVKVEEVFGPAHTPSKIDKISHKTKGNRFFFNPSVDNKLGPVLTDRLNYGN